MYPQITYNIRIHWTILITQYCFWTISKDMYMISYRGSIANILGSIYISHVYLLLWIKYSKIANFSSETEYKIVWFANDSSCYKFLLYTIHTLDNINVVLGHNHSHDICDLAWENRAYVHKTHCFTLFYLSKLMWKLYKFCQMSWIVHCFLH